MWVPTSNGGGVFVLLKKVLVADDVPHDVMDTQEMFAEHGWRFRFEDDFKVHLPEGTTVLILRCTNGLPGVRVMPMTQQDVPMAVTHITVAQGAHQILLQAARLGVPKAEQLRMMVRRAQGACVTEKEFDAKATRLLDYCLIRKSVP